MRLARLRRSILGTALAVGMFTAPALAHNYLLDVFPFFGNVEGTAFFSTGVFPRVGTVVEVFGPDGTRVGETTTSARGAFVYTPTMLGDHTFRSDAGDGHVATLVLPVTAADFPALAAALVPPAVTAPAADAAEAGDAAMEAAGADAGAAVSAPAVAGGVTEAQVRQIVSESAVALGTQMRNLRESIELSRRDARTEGIIGGIGYILGLFGIGFFVMAWMRLRALGLTMGGRPAVPGSATPPATETAAPPRRASPPQREAAE